MSDISTYGRFKDWLMLALVGAVLTLLGMVAAENRQRIFDIEARVARLESVYERLARIESIVERIERRLP